MGNSMTDRAAASERTGAINDFVARHANGANADLLVDMLGTVCRLADDDCDRGSLKILARALRELRYAFKTFAPYRDVPKVSMFGSARTPEGHPQYLQALKFADLIRRHGWMVITGAGDGIMRAGHDGATREASFGVAISLPFEQGTNNIIAGDDKLIHFKYFFTRKLMFIKEAWAIALFPGGFGTQDEGFECLTLVQTGKTNPVPIIMIDEPGGTYWEHWRTYVTRELLGPGMISPDDLQLFYMTDSADAAIEEIVRFYRRYHSSRYVGERFVIRMHSPLSEGALGEINERFARLVLDGTFEQHRGPVEGERGEWPDKARLAFHHNRRSAGHLRQLINFVNQAD